MRLNQISVLLLLSLLLSPQMLLSQASTIPNLTTDSSPSDTDWMIVHKVGETRSKKQSRATVRDNLSGVGVCTNQVVTATVENAGPTCSNISSAMIPGGTILPSDLATGADVPADEECYTYESTGAVGEWQTCAGGGGGAPTDASYLTLGLDGTLSNERVYTTGVGIAGTDAGAGSTFTIGLWSGDTLAANPTYSTEDVVFTKDGTGGGLLFEGSAADTTEGIIIFDPTSSDKTITVPNVTGTLITSADTGTVTGTMVATNTIPDGDIQDAITISGGTIGSNTLTGAVTTSGLTAEPGQASLGATPHYLGIADGTPGTPITNAQPTVVNQRWDAVGSGATSIAYANYCNHTQGSGFHYCTDSWARDNARNSNDVTALDGRIIKEPFGIVLDVVATPSASGGTLATNTYRYYVSAIVSSEEIVGSQHATAAVTGPNGSVDLTWTALSGAASYKVYRYIPSSPSTATVWFASAGTSFTDTGAAGTGGIGLSSTGWGVWAACQKTAHSSRCAGVESGVENNSGLDAPYRPDVVGTTIGGQFVSAGTDDNSIGLHITGVAPSAFRRGIVIDTNAFNEVGIDFSDSTAALPAIRLDNTQDLVAINAAGTANTHILEVDSSDRVQLGGGAVTVDGILQRLGILTTSPDERFEIESAENAETRALVENTNGSGTGALAALRVAADTAAIALHAHGTGRTTSRFGVTIGGYSELLGVGGNGLLLGTSTSAPIIFGTALAAKFTINADGSIDIPEMAVPSNPSADIRRLFVDSATGEISVRTSAGTTISLEDGGAGGSTNAFGTIDAPAGTDPVADAAPDTLAITCGSGLTCTGTSGTDTLDFTLALADANIPDDVTVASSATTIAGAGRLQLGSLTLGSASCIAISSDRPYADKDCDSTQDAGEEFLDEAVGGGAVDPITNPSLVEDFLPGSTEGGEVGTQGWSTSATSSQQIPSESNHPGIFQLVTAATTSNIARVGLGSGGPGSMILPTDVSTFTWIIRPQTVTSVRIRAGILQDIGGSEGGTAGAYFELDTAESTSWQVVTRQASTTTAATCSGTVTAATWYKLAAVRNGSGNWEYSINGTLCATNTTNLPTTAANFGSMIEAREAVAKTLEVDYAAIEFATLTR